MDSHSGGLGGGHEMDGGGVEGGEVFGGVRAMRCWGGVESREVGEVVV